LEEAFIVAKAIQEKNAGKAWKPILLAEALGIKAGSTNFRDITSSSNKYGITAGTWNSDYVSLTQLGITLTRPTDKTKEMKAKQQAVLNIELFSKIYDHYRDNKFPLPSDTYFKNMLETEFGVPRQLIDECIRLLTENGKYSGILRDSQGSLYVLFSETPPEIEEQPKPEGETEGEPAPSATPPAPVVPPPCPPVTNQIFVIHGKNKVPLEQLKKILDDPFKIPYKVAEDEPNVGRPISQKVAETMKNCNSAIVIFTADEEFMDSKGNKIYRPSDNAVYELGAASILYGKKIVILKEQGVSLETDFSDIGHITFDKDRLDSKTSDLMRELLGFGLLKVVTA
jgi:hypothetical protein